MAGVNPDNTEAEVGNIWRQLYKLERAFEANPNATKICTKVGPQSCVQLYFSSLILPVLNSKPYHKFWFPW